MLSIRRARLSDHSELTDLMLRSFRELAPDYYASDQIDSAMAEYTGIDTALIDDATLFVAENADKIVGCGGWSFRQCLLPVKNAVRQPAFHACNSPHAVLRSFFVHPEHVRKGIATALFERCRAEAPADLWQGRPDP